MRECRLEASTFEVVVVKRRSLLREAGPHTAPIGRVRAQIRAGVVLALVVVTVVGVTGIVQWSQRLVVTALVAGVAILGVNLIVVLIRHWHRRNTALESSYAGAEEVVRLRRPRPAGQSRRMRS